MMARVLRGLVRLYQLAVSPFLGECCRFYPSCSDYALEALKVHGSCKGAWLAVVRGSYIQGFERTGGDE